MNRTILPVLATLSLLAPSPFRAAADATSPNDIVATAKAAGSFGTLLAAVGAAGLVETLQSPGPFTVFAPTDAAFAKLPKGTVESLLEPAALEKLKTILTYHVVSGRVLSKSLLPVSEAQTVARMPVSFGLKVGSATVIQADILCSNGVIHVINEVLLPPAPSAPKMVPASQGMTATAVIRAALDRGVPLYNDGHHDACAKI